MDKARAERINLTLGDLGPGWSVDASPDQGGSSDAAIDQAFDKALAAKGLALSDAKTADVDSPDFVKGDVSGVSSSASVYRAVDQARRDFTVTSQPDFISALADGVNTGIRDGLANDPETKGVTASLVTFTKGAFPILGEESFALRGATTIRASGSRTSLNFDFVFIRLERVVAGLFAFQTGKRFPDAELQGLATKVAQRMAP